MRTRNRNQKRMGATLVEVMIASALTAFVLTGALATLYTGMRSWVAGQSKIEAETDGSQAIRTISIELREAMSVTVASDGNSISYRLPKRDSNGDFIVPVEWDGVSRRVVVQPSGTKYALLIGVFGNEALLTKNVILVDPERAGSPAYRVFTAGPGAITRSVNIQVVTRTTNEKGGFINHRVRETLFLRNIPAITQ